MAALKWAVICQRVLTDQQTNAVSYIDLIEDVHVPQLPYALPVIAVGTVWEREGGESIAVRVRAMDPNDALLATIEGVLESAEARFHRANFRIGLVAENVGRYQIVVEQEVDRRWREEARISFLVERMLLEEELPASVATPRRIADERAAAVPAARRRTRRRASTD
jgi:hypothetical protein